MKLSDLNSGPPCYLNHGSYRGHKFYIQWSVGEPLRQIHQAIFRWHKQGLFPFRVAVKVAKFMEEEYTIKKFAWLVAIELDEEFDG